MLLFDVIKRPNLLRRLQLIIPALALGVLALIFYRFSEAREGLARSRIVSHAETAELRLTNLMNPVINNLKILRGWGASGIIDPRNPVELNAKLAPVLNQLPIIDGVVIADRDRFLYSLRRHGEYWVTGFRIGDGAESVQFVRWTLWEDPLETWTGDVELSEGYSDTYGCLLGNLDGGDICWSEPIRVQSEEREPLVGVVGWKPGGHDKQTQPQPQSQSVYALAVTVGAGEAIRNLTRSMGGMDSRVMVVNEREQVVSIQDRDYGSIRSYSLAALLNLRAEDDDHLYTLAVQSWLAQDVSRTTVSRFTHAERAWWCGFRPLAQISGDLQVAVVVQEGELIADLGERRYPSMLIVASILSFAVLSVIMLRFAYRMRIRSLTSLDRALSSLAADFDQLLRAGESETLEFKSSLRWDIGQGQVNKKLEEVVLKTVGAFNNSRGGTLIIGVDDGGSVLGLENDYGSLKKGGRDYFELHLRNLLNDAYGIEYASRSVAVLFHEVGGREVCILSVRRGVKPLYTTIADRSGRRIERFYIRSGNSSRELEKPSDVVSYIQTRFKGSEM
jgi:hypothetical protein